MFCKCNTEFNRGKAINKQWHGKIKFTFYGSKEYIWSDGTNTYFSNGANKQYVLNKTTSVWEPKQWNVTINYSSIWTDGTNIYSSDGSSQYVLNKSTSTWSTKTWNNYTPQRGSYIWSDGTNVYYSSGSNQYVLDKSTSTWNAKTWNG